jgi:hypothetical protein
MRCAVFSIVVLAFSLLSAIPSQACPSGYARCGNYCCPTR